MSPWAANEFERVGVSTKLSTRTLAACRDVLVNGVAGVDAAVAHGMKPSQISRGISVLRNARDEVSKSAELFKSEGALLRLTAEQVAKNIAGQALTIVDAAPGNVYEGRVIANTCGFMVQQIGRIGVMHDLGNLEKLPASNNALNISYPVNGGKAAVRESTLLELSKGVGR